MRRSILVVALVMLGVIQAVPYGGNHTNPPVRVELPWDSERTRRLAGRLCFDCHSKVTVWPWFSQVAPISWLIQRDVEHGRRVVNFSEWDRRQNEAPESATALRSGEMPPGRYAWLRPGVRLSATEREDGRGTTARDRMRRKGARQTRAGHA